MCSGWTVREVAAHLTMAFHVSKLPAEHVNAVLSFLVSPKATRGFVRKGLVAGLRCESSDSGWAAGSGPSVSGTAQSLVLALTGRRAGLAGLAGDGAAELARRLG